MHTPLPPFAALCRPSPPFLSPPVVVQGIGGIAVVYAALMASRSFCAINRCVAALGCTASHENAVPNGLALHSCPMRGNGRTAVGTVRSESSVPLGSRYAQPCAVACVEMNVLYAVTAVTSFTSSFGTTTAATVSAQSRLRGAPSWAAPSSAAPYGNGTSVESPRAPGMPVAIGAQFE